MYIRLDIFTRESHLLEHKFLSRIRARPSQVFTETFDSYQLFSSLSNGLLPIYGKILVTCIGSVTEECDISIFIEAGKSSV